jgi:hypothetical protein
MTAQIILTVVQTVFISTIIYFLQRKFKRSEEEAEKHAETRKKESRLNLNMTMATMSLSYATALAIKKGKVNGEVEEGIRAFRKAKQDYMDFLNEQAIENLDEQRR